MKSLFFICSILLCMAVVAQSEIRHVPDDYETIQAGIDAAEEGDTVLVAPGEYVTRLVVADKSIVLASRYLLDDNPDLINETIINTNGYGSGIKFSGIDCRATLYGFTFRNGVGESDGDEEDGWGGAVTVLDHAAPKLNSLIIRDNYDGHGAVYCVDMDQAVWKDITFINNQGFYSGCIVLWRSTLTIDGGLFDGNTGLLGSCYFLSIPGSSHIILNRCEFLRNLGEAATIGEIQTNSISELNNCYIHDNLPAGEAPDHTGAAEFVRSSGGVIHLRNTVITCIENDDSLKAAVRITRTGPEPSTITNCTIVNMRGYGIYGWNGAGEFIVKNTILWGNARRAPGLQGRQYFGNIEFSFCDIMNSNIEGNLNQNPLFVDWDEQDYHLTAESPCIDEGDPDFPLDPDGTRADMGAFYFHQEDEEPPRIIEIFPEEMELSVFTGDTVEFIVRAEDDRQDTLDYLWVLNEDTLSTDTMLTLIFEELGIQSVTCYVSDGVNQNSVSWEINVFLSVASNVSVPNGFTLSAFPNPFNASTTIEYRVGANSNPTTLAIYDMSGRLVDRLVQGNVPAGYHNTVWDASGVGAGVYFVRLEGLTEKLFTKVVVLK